MQTSTVVSIKPVGIKKVVDLTVNKNHTFITKSGIVVHNCGFILTCNYSNRIIPALHSRCTSINLAISPDEKKALMVESLDRIQYVLKQESIVYEEKLVIGAIKRFWPDIRRTINEIQRACVDGVLTPSVLGQHNDIQYDALWKAIKARNYKDARTWIGQYADIDPSKFYRAVFDWMHENAQESTLPTLIILIADYQYKHLNAIDPHVHMAAFILEMMHNGQFK